MGFIVVFELGSMAEGSQRNIVLSSEAEISFSVIRPSIVAAWMKRSFARRILDSVVSGIFPV